MCARYFIILFSHQLNFLITRHRNPDQDRLHQGLRQDHWKQQKGQCLLSRRHHLQYLELMGHWKQKGQLQDQQRLECQHHRYQSLQITSCKLSGKLAHSPLGYKSQLAFLGSPHNSSKPKRKTQLHLPCHSCSHLQDLAQPVDLDPIPAQLAEFQLQPFFWLLRHNQGYC